MPDHACNYEPIECNRDPEWVCAASTTHIEQRQAPASRPGRGPVGWTQLIATEKRTGARVRHAPPHVTRALELALNRITQVPSTLVGVETLRWLQAQGNSISELPAHVYPCARGRAALAQPLTDQRLAAIGVDAHTCVLATNESHSCGHPAPQSPIHRLGRRECDASSSRLLVHERLTRVATALLSCQWAQRR